MTTALAIPPRWAGDRLLTQMVGHVLHVHHDEHAIVVEHETGRGRAILGAGSPEHIALLLGAVRPEGIAHGSVIRGTWEHLPPALRERFDLPVVEDWDWMDIHHVPQAAGAERVRELDPDTERASIERVRQAAIPDSFLSVDRPGSRWYGWPDAQGAIRAIGGATGWDGADWPTGAHFGSIGTEPGWQGRGIGSALTAGMVALAFAEGARSASLGVHTHNHRALGIYRRLGFTTTYAIHSRHRAA